MLCIVLCAGFATRLGELTRHRPKHLLPLAGKPMLDHLLRRLDLPDLDPIVVVTNRRFAGQFEAWRAESAHRQRVELIVGEAETPPDARGAVRDLAFALDTVGGPGDFFVANGDNVFTFSVQPMIESLATKGSTIALYDVGDRTRVRQSAEATVDRFGRVTSFVEKPQRPTGTIASIGLYAFRASVRPLIRRYLDIGGSPDRTGDLITWLHLVTPVYAWLAPTSELRFDIGTREEYERAEAQLTDLWRA